MTLQFDPVDSDFDDLHDLRDEAACVRDSLTALGRLLGASLAVPRRDLASFAREHLGVPDDRITRVKVDLVGVTAPLVQWQVARLLDLAPDAVLTGSYGRGTPDHRVIATDVDDEATVPDDLAAALSSHHPLGLDAVLLIQTLQGVRQLSLAVRTDDKDAAREQLAELLRKAATAGNFYRGKTLRADTSLYGGLRLSHLERLQARREDVLHSSDVWDAIDANIGGLSRHGDALAAADLGTSRGLLIVGRPGVGKTALCRVIATELPEGTTVVLVDAGIGSRSLAELYDSIEMLAPVALFFDDIDLMAGDRRGGSPGELLHHLLTRLDGLSVSVPVITIATTNNADVVDPALVRPGRFDDVLVIAPPERSLREQILRRYVTPLADLDVAPVAMVTDGASGADLREIVRRAVLEHGPELTTALLLDVARTGRWRPTIPTGQYL
jgi:hypothetical protein